MDTPVRVEYDGRVISLGGRVAAMVRWLTEQAERLNGVGKMRLEFNCNGFKRVVPKLEIYEDEVMVG